MGRPRALVIRAAGTNCDRELMRGLTLAGADPELVHLDALVRDARPLATCDLIALPGGFSYGDDIASGRIFAVRLRERLYEPFRQALARGCPVIGICNGFQILVQAGLLPGPAPGEPWPAAPPRQTVALAENIQARFVDRWVRVQFERDSVCAWTRGVAEAFADLDPQTQRQALQLPVAHGEGRLVAASPQILADLQRTGRVAVRYDEEVNGSQDGIAGLCDASGLVFGLMPHPERYLDWTRHPFWTRLPTRLRRRPTPGLMIFRNAVRLAERVSA